MLTKTDKQIQSIQLHDAAGRIVLVMG